jgi:hypothetical protein
MEPHEICFFYKKELFLDFLHNNLLQIILDVRFSILLLKKYLFLWTKHLKLREIHQ